MNTEGCLAGRAAKPARETNNEMANSVDTYWLMDAEFLPYCSTCSLPKCVYDTDSHYTEVDCPARAIILKERRTTESVIRSTEALKLKRQRRLDRLQETINDCGAQTLSDLHDISGVPYSTIYDWVRNGLLTITTEVKQGCDIIVILGVKNGNQSSL